MPRTARRAMPALLTAAALTLAACSSTDDSGGSGAAEDATTASADATEADSERITVVAAAYPLEFLAGAVGGDLVTVESLAPAGAEPHDLELAPAQVNAVENADLVVYLEGFQTAVDDAVAQTSSTALDLIPVTLGVEHEHDHAEDEHAEEEADTEDSHDGHDHGDLDFDPHVWLDPLRMAAAAEALAEELSALDPAGAETFHANADALIAELNGLDEAYHDGLASCERDVIVVSHEAYGYLAESYGFEQVGLSGIDPDTEPSPAKVREIEQVVTENGVTTIFVETLLSPDVAEVLANDLGITTALLSPLESEPEDGGDYLTQTEANLEALRTAMDCA
ncbi:metal ABC transporter substrate-binding protein [Serinibacter salmoneus]|nr:metal ABC transporter substrate-binding protein [Serinibacter salmoneus]